ncbi:GH3 auxin-responsive promoter [Cynara cardunculus var. scolymus]|uniref:GH3 auxin-responsive promoter n=1 Tax=Cynara cardunculus var. scolymus TaxID=59895 RepID=A0A118K6S5_CYNCS|nr:GH3 auxin-responsive promoter [Cynara cardunculus var. scolymus]
MTSSTDTDQANVLAAILSRNAKTEYLKLYNLDGATNRETFKSKNPMVTYKDLQPHIQRVVNGDRSPIYIKTLVPGLIDFPCDDA